MSQEQAKQLLQQGIAAARGGRPDIARQTLQQVVRIEPANETAWLWLSSVAADNKERVFCLRKLLEINPRSEPAIKGLRALGIDPVPTSEVAPSSGVPVLDETRYSRVIQAADEFLRRYNPQPPDRLDIHWTHKTRGRYSEGGAKRLRQVAYAAAALVVVALVAGLVFLATQLDISTEGGLRIGSVPTRIPSQTPRPTFTPTVGGPTPTPFPTNMAVPATRVPQGINPGNPFALAVPTNIYPAPDQNVRRILIDAVNYYSIGAYDVALERLTAEREKSLPSCYGSLVYYEALSQAALENYSEALEILTWASTYEPENQIYDSCQGDPLLLTGLAQVWYMQDPQSQEAMAFAEQALAEDPQLVQASLIKARAQLARDDTTGARSTVSQALADAPLDANLLLAAAEVELASNQPVAALAYIGQVLFADPASLPALYLQAETYLQAASLPESATGDRRLQYYGLAVRSAQTLLLYYSGDPAGYLYLAKARIGEGNEALAETALTRIIEIEDTLPEQATATIREAYRLRGELRYRQGRAAEALADLKTYTATGRPDPQVLLQVIDSALQAGEYSDALDGVYALVDLEPDNTSYMLLQARMLVEICTFHPEVSCEYRATLQSLTDSFIAQLASDVERADALSFRAQAQYWDTTQRGSSLSSADRRSSLQRARNDINQALAVRETAVDHYYRGLILDALDQPVQALEAYQWVMYWSEVYPYPFKDRDFERRVASLADEVEELLTTPEATEVPTETTPEAEETEEPEGTEEPEATRVPGQIATATPAPTVRPTRTPAPTATPPAEDETPLPIP